MKAVILAAGKGKRMGTLTEEKPKPLLLVGGKTFLERIISTLPPEIDEVIVVVGYKGEQIRAFLDEKFLGRKVSYVVNDNVEKGNAHSLLLTRGHFKQKERFVLIYSDELPSSGEMTACLSHEFSWLTHIVDDPAQSGVVTLSSDGRILELEEKPLRPKSNIAAGGVMVVNADIFSYPPRQHRNGEYYLTFMMEEFIKHHNVQAVTGTKNLFFSTPGDIDRFNKKC
jgi:NDP-sugar pyrophosphorylase family protein